MPPARPRRAPRSDARENRARLVESARAAFRDDPSASLASIAKAAGVGQGTLYRHFSGREELLLAVHESEVAGLAGDAGRLLEEHEPLEALRLWLERIADGGGRYGRCHPPVLAALELLLAAGRDKGQVRADAGAEDVLILGAFLWEGGRDGAAWRERRRRMLDVLLDGLRGGDGPP
jgi:AcrR family transcriptional regulator